MLHKENNFLAEKMSRPCNTETTDCEDTACLRSFTSLDEPCDYHQVPTSQDVKRLVPWNMPSSAALGKDVCLHISVGNQNLGGYLSVRVSCTLCCTYEDICKEICSQSSHLKKC